MKPDSSTLFGSLVRRSTQIYNGFTEDGDSYLSAPLINTAIDDAVGEIPSSPLPYFGFLDLSGKRDLTSVVLVLWAPARWPEAYDHLITASVTVWGIAGHGDRTAPAHRGSRARRPRLRSPDCLASELDAYAV
jgi:hypothetical protein